MGAIVRAPRRPGVVLDTGMCGRSLLGNRETPRLTTGRLPDWSASGRRGAVADDERTRGVRLRHSSWEADEQGRAIRCGAGGGQGKCGPAKHAPGAEPGERVPGAGAHTANCKAKEERRSSPRSSTTSVSITSRRHSLNSRRMLHGLTCRDYEQHLERNLEDLHARVHRG